MIVNFRIYIITRDTQADWIFILIKKIMFMELNVK